MLDGVRSGDLEKVRLMFGKNTVRSWDEQYGLWLKRKFLIRARLKPCP